MFHFTFPRPENQDLYKWDLKPFEPHAKERFYSECWNQWHIKKRYVASLLFKETPQTERKAKDDHPLSY